MRYNKTKYLWLLLFVVMQFRVYPADYAKQHNDTINDDSSISSGRKISFDSKNVKIDDKQSEKRILYFLDLLPDYDSLSPKTYSTENYQMTIDKDSIQTITNINYYWNVIDTNTSRSFGKPNFYSGNPYYVFECDSEEAILHFLVFEDARNLDSKILVGIVKTKPNKINHIRIPIYELMAIFDIKKIIKHKEKDKVIVDFVQYAFKRDKLISKHIITL